MLLLLQHSRVADCLFRLGGSTTLSCQVDTAKCGDYHSIKWYRDGLRVAVYSNIHTFRSVTLAKCQSEYKDDKFDSLGLRRMIWLDEE